MWANLSMFLLEFSGKFVYVFVRVFNIRWVSFVIEFGKRDLANLWRGL